MTAYRVSFRRRYNGPPVGVFEVDTRAAAEARRLELVSAGLLVAIMDMTTLELVGEDEA
jgi:hypothetical protein